MRPRWSAILAALLLQVALLVASLLVEGLGAPGWHHLASLAASVLLLLPFRSYFATSRAFLGLGVLVTTVLAVGSGFFILYWKPWLKDHALVDWIKFWHIFWSWLSIAFFVFHTWINRAPLGQWWSRLHRMPVGALLLYGGLVAAAVLSAIPWTQGGKDLIGDANYIPLTWATWLVLLVPTYALWWATVLGRSWSALSGVTAGLSHAKVRGFVDVALVPWTILANASGFPITFWKEQVHGAGFKFAGKATHTLPSIVMAILIFAHVVHLWGPTARHWQRLREAARA